MISVIADPTINEDEKIWIGPISSPVPHKSGFIFIRIKKNKKPNTITKNKWKMVYLNQFLNLPSSIHLFALILFSPKQLNTLDQCILRSTKYPEKFHKTPNTLPQTVKVNFTNSEFLQ